MSIWTFKDDIRNLDFTQILKINTEVDLSFKDNITNLEFGQLLKWILKTSLRIRLLSELNIRKLEFGFTEVEVYLLLKLILRNFNFKVVFSNLDFVNLEPKGCQKQKKKQIEKKLGAKEVQFWKLIILIMTVEQILSIEYALYNHEGKTRRRNNEVVFRLYMIWWHQTEILIVKVPASPPIL